MPDVRRGHRDVFGETAVAVNTDDLRKGTHVRVAGAAKQTSSVHNVPLGGDAVAFAHVGDELTDFDDVAREFVTDGERWLASPARPRIPIVDVNVGAADTCAAHPYEHFIISHL